VEAAWSWKLWPVGDGGAAVVLWVKMATGGEARQWSRRGSSSTFESRHWPKQQLFKTFIVLRAC